MGINPSSHTPIYLQIAQDIRQRVAAGVYRPGEALPSLRQLALGLSVNPNTVQRAYERLEREGLICSRRGVGLFVAQQGTASAESRVEEELQRAFASAMSQAVAANLSPERIQARFDQACRDVYAPERGESC